MGMFMNRKEKHVYEKIANITDEEKAKEMLELWKNFGDSKEMNVEDLRKALEQKARTYQTIAECYNLIPHYQTQVPQGYLKEKWISLEDALTVFDETFSVADKSFVHVPRKQLAPLKYDDFKCPKCDTLNHRIITWNVLKDEIELKLVFFCEDCGHSEPVNLIKVLDELI